MYMKHQWHLQTLMVTRYLGKLQLCDYMYLAILAIASFHLPDALAPIETHLKIVVNHASMSILHVFTFLTRKTG